MASGEKTGLVAAKPGQDSNELMDRYDDAIADYNALEQELKRHPRSHLHWDGDCQKHKGNYILAMKEYQKALDLEGRDA